MSSPFPSRLKEIRENAGFSQNALARALDLAVSTISRLESGDLPNPTLDTIARICAFFGVTREWLLDGREPMFSDESATVAWSRYDHLLDQKLGTEKQREKRQERLLAEISARLTQIPYCDPPAWKIFRQQIIESMDAHATFCLKHSAELKLARLKAGRAISSKKMAK